MQARNILWALPIYRAWADMTQEELAEVSGVSRITISRLESQTREPRPSTVSKLADALGVEPQGLADYELLRIAGYRRSRR